jgi:hypothetical protein
MPRAQKLLHIHPDGLLSSDYPMKRGEVLEVRWWPPGKYFPEGYRATGSQVFWSGLIAKEKE